jgi:hypothetical protein
MLHSARAAIGQRAQPINAARGLLSELGIAAARDLRDLPGFAVPEDRPL